MVESSHQEADRRRYPRFAVSAAGLIHGEDGVACRCIIENLSAGGVLISEAPVLKLGESVHLVMRLPDRLPFVLSGTVARFGHSTDTYGLAFDDPTDQYIDSESATLWALEEMSHSLNSALIIDESLAMCRSLVHDLHQLYCSAVAVRTPLDAVDWLLASGGSTTTAFADADLVYSGEGGLLKLLAEDYPAVRRVLMTGLDTARRAHQPLPFDDVLPKPWTLEQLSRVLR